MKPIPTEFEGVQFRSRLEARWAVFFSAMEIPYVYEPRPFNIQNLGIYCPDFLLLNGQYLAEVKPEWPTSLEILKARGAIPLANVIGTIILIGQPEYKGYWMLTQQDGIADEQPVMFELGKIVQAQDWQIAYGTKKDTFDTNYARAINLAMHSKFDGFDLDREKIRRRYQ